MQRRVFVIRIWQDMSGVRHGQVSDPEDGRRLPFRTPGELWHILTNRANPPDADISHPPSIGEQSDEL